MFTIVFAFSERGIRSVIREMDEWYSVRLTEAQLERLIKKNPGLLSDIHPTQGILSTGGRDDLMEAICEDIGMSRGWPIYADGKAAMQRFVKELKVKAKAKRYKITMDEDED